MANEARDPVIRYLHTILGLDSAGPSNSDEEAFDRLVRRHGPLVMGVCRRILGAGADADDAYQATFFVLARKAAQIRKRESVGSWLHGVCHAISRKLQGKRSRERGRQVAIGNRVETLTMSSDPIQKATLRELGAILDDEIQRLPLSCRAALVACHFEGQSTAAAARQLGVPTSTLKTRLARGRELLRQRLERRGIGISVVALSIFLGEQSRVRAASTLLETTVTASLQFAAAGAGAGSTHAAVLAANALRVSLLGKVTVGFVAMAAMGFLGLAAMPTASAPKGPEPILPEPEVVQQVEPPEPNDAELPVGALARLGTPRWRHDRTVGYAAFRPDGKSVVSVGDDVTIRVWEFPSGKEIRRINLLKEKTTTLSADFRVSYFAAAALSPDGKTIATCMNFREIRLHDVDSGQELPGLKTVEKTYELVFAADGQRLVSIDASGVHIWNWSDGKLITKIAGDGDANRLTRVMAYSPNAKIVATFDYDDSNKNAPPIRTLILWNAETGAEIARVDRDQEYVNFHAPVFSPDAKTLAYPVSSKGDIVLVNTSDLSKRRTIHVKAADVDYLDFNALVFSKDGSKLYGRKRGDSIVVEWDVASGKLLRELGSAGISPNHIHWFWPPTPDRLALSPDGKTLLLAGGDNRLTFLDIESGQPTVATSGHTRPIVSLQFSPDGKRILTQDLNPTVHQWSVRGADLGALATPGKPAQIVLSPDGTVLAARTWRRFGLGFNFFESATRTAFAMPAQSGPQNSSHEPIVPMVLSGGGKHLVAYARLQSRFEVFDVPSGRLRQHFDIPIDAISRNEAPFAYLPHMILSRDDALLASYFDLRSATVWDLATGYPKGLLSLPVRDPNARYSWRDRPLAKGAFTPDGRCLTIFLESGDVAMYELASGQVRRTFGKRSVPAGAHREKLVTHQNGGPVTEPLYGPHLSISTDGRFLAHADFDQSVHFWDIATGVELATFRGHTAPLNAVAFAPDGNSIASGGWDTTAIVWDVRKWNHVPAPIKALEPAELAAKWDVLAIGTAAEGFDANVAFAASPKETVAYFSERLKPMMPVNAKRIDLLIEQLNSSEFKIRDAANNELLKIGDLAAPALEKALATNPPLEIRRRLEALHDLSNPNSMFLKGERLRAHRAIEVLERIDTPEARRVLTALAGGAPGSLLTTSAQEALRRAAGRIFP